MREEIFNGDDVSEEARTEDWHLAGLFTENDKDEGDAPAGDTAQYEDNSQSGDLSLEEVGSTDWEGTSTSTTRHGRVIKKPARFLD